MSRTGLVKHIKCGRDIGYLTPLHRHQQAVDQTSGTAAAGLHCHSTTHQTPTQLTSCPRELPPLCKGTARLANFKRHTANDCRRGSCILPNPQPKVGRHTATPEQLASRYATFGEEHASLEVANCLASMTLYLAFGMGCGLVQDEADEKDQDGEQDDLDECEEDLGGGAGDGSSDAAGDSEEVHCCLGWRVDGKLLGLMAVWTVVWSHTTLLMVGLAVKV